MTQTGSLTVPCSAREALDLVRAGLGYLAAADAAWAALEQAVIGKAVDLLSGLGGLASFLRRRQFGAKLGGPGLPLDISHAETSATDCVLLCSFTTSSSSTSGAGPWS